MINRPHALYHNGELIGIITNPDPFPGGIASIVEALDLEANADPNCTDAVTIPHNMGNLDDWAKFAQGVVALGVTETIEVERDEEDTPIHPNDSY